MPLMKRGPVARVKRDTRTLAQTLAHPPRVPRRIRKERQRAKSRRANAKLRSAGLVKVFVWITARDREAIRLQAQRLGAFTQCILRAAVEIGLRAQSTSEISRVQREWIATAGLSAVPRWPGTPNQHDPQTIGRWIRKWRADQRRLKEAS